MQLNENCNSLMCKYLTPELFEKLKDKKTSNNFTLQEAIQSGLDNLDSSIGIYAGDLESYKIFADIFNPIIEEYHGFREDDIHKSDMDYSKLDFENLDEDGEFIFSTRVRVGRNLANFALGAAVNREDRLKIEKLVSETLLDAFEGTYYSLEHMSEEEKNFLIIEHFLFKEGDRFLASAGLNRDWPSGRGIFHNSEKTFLVWINEEDELRVISMQQGADIKEVFIRLVEALKKLESKLAFLYDEHLGYISSCPTNLGTAMRASVHIKLEKLSKKQELFDAICEKYHLQVRGIHGEHSESEGSVYDVSNRRRLGVSEIECISDLYYGVKALIEASR